MGQPGSGQFQGDTSKFRQSFSEHKDLLDHFSQVARDSGAIHHQFGVGDGFLMVIDEWGSVEQYRKFISNPELQEFIGQLGAAPAPPLVTVAEAAHSSDQF
ncbi:MAG TPA: hypothetical protein VGG25_09600 [Streptosporangiaceae bacterium]